MDDTNTPDATGPDDAITPDVQHALSAVRDACLDAPLAVEPRLAHLLAYGVPTPAAEAPALSPRRHRMKLLAAKIAAAAAAAVAATGGLAAASALPAPVQHVVSGAASHVGVDFPSPDDGAALDDDSTSTTSTTEATEPSDDTEPTSPTTATTVPSDDDTGTAPDADNHGHEVSAVAHDDSTHGCEHGRAVSAVASGRVNDKPCPDHDASGNDGDDESAPPSTEAPGATAPTTVREHPGNGHYGDDQGDQDQGEDGNGGDHGGRGEHDRGHQGDED